MPVAPPESRIHLVVANAQIPDRNDASGFELAKEPAHAIREQ
jgi:hypothetical protein